MNLSRPCPALFSFRYGRGDGRSFIGARMNIVGIPKNPGVEESEGFPLYEEKLAPSKQGSAWDVTPRISPKSCFVNRVQTPIGCSPISGADQRAGGPITRQTALPRSVSSSSLVVDDLQGLREERVLARELALDLPLPALAGLPGRVLRRSISVFRMFKSSQQLN